MLALLRFELKRQLLQNCWSFGYATAALLSLGATSGFASVLVYYAMIGRVNRYLPDSEQIGYVFRVELQECSKPFRLFREHRRLYPNSALPAICVLLDLAAFAFFVIAVFRQ